jgi:hypothetical protein
VATGSSGNWQCDTVAVWQVTVAVWQCGTVAEWQLAVVAATVAVPVAEWQVWQCDKFDTASQAAALTVAVTPAVAAWL